jgi:multidrug efflux pump subunit AcrB
VKSFNLSDWALDHRSLVWYFMIIFIIAGAFSYLNLGREEDPDFTIKTMIINAQWPGASAEEVTKQVTDRIEKKLQELDALDYTRSETKAGQTTIYVELLPTTKAKDVTGNWIRVRNMVNDIKGDLPSGVLGHAAPEDHFQGQRYFPIIRIVNDPGTTGPAPRPPAGTAPRSTLIT